MKKLLKKVVALCLGAAISCSLLFAAGCSKGLEDTEDNLIIETYLAGYGTSFLEKVKEKFEEVYPGKTVDIVESVTLLGPEAEMKLKAGPKYNSTDLFFVGAPNFIQFVAKGEDMLKGYDCILEDLSDVYNSPAYGEETLIKDKINPEQLDYFTFVEDGKQYTMPWGAGINGMVYHSDVFEENGWDVPLTTNDMIALVEEIKADGWVPFTWPGGIGYWQYVFMVQWAQFEGLEGYRDFFRAKDANGNYTYELFAQEGRLEAMKYLEALIGPEENSFEGSITMNHTQSQMKFLDKENKIAMMPNGDWLEKEMTSNFPAGSVEIKMMKSPVISSITKKLDTVKTEEKLKEVITAVDNGETSVEGVSEADFERIAEARSMMYSSSGFDHNVLIPVYANAKDLAKDFLRILYSDWGLKTYLQETQSMLPFQGDLYKDEDIAPTLTTFQQSKFEIQENSTMITGLYYYDPLFYLASLRPFNYVTYIETKIGAIGEDKMTAAEYFAADYEWIASRFEQYKQNAGIKE